LLFRDRVFARGWGIPKKLISDRDPKFLSKFWQTLQRILGVASALSVVDHPQTDGTTERVNSMCLEIIRTFSTSLGSRWDEYLPLIEFAINFADNASTGYSPFFLLYGQHPRVPGQLLYSQITAQTDGNFELCSHLHLRHLLLNSAKRNIIAAQAKQKAQYDKNYKAPTPFQIGDFVYVSSHSWSICKTDARWLGPYEVLERIGDLNYRLSLPSTFNTHPIFHTNKLKLAIVSGDSSAPIPPVLVPPRDIECILSHKRGPGGYLQFLVKYRDESLDSAEWLKFDAASLLNRDIVDSYVKFIPTTLPL